MKQLLTTNWNGARVFRVAIGLVAIIYAIYQRDNTMMGLTNTGCCGTSGCTTNETSKNKQMSDKEVSFEEVK
jgi:hypothetical protein